jgi:hypothetical protein
MAKKQRVKPAVRRETEARLRRIARAAEVFVDGDAFREFVLKPEMNTGDEYLVDHAKFIALKQALMKLKRLESGDVGVITWRRFGDQADLCLGIDSHPCAVRPGNHPVSPAMAEAFAGRPAAQDLEMRGHPLLGVCAPIRDSLDDVVGVVEVFASLEPETFRVDGLDY